MLSYSEQLTYLFPLEKSYPSQFLLGIRSGFACPLSSKIGLNLTQRRHLTISCHLLQETSLLTY